MFIVRWSTTRKRFRAIGERLEVTKRLIELLNTLLNTCRLLSRQSGFCVSRRHWTARLYSWLVDAVVNVHSENSYQSSVEMKPICQHQKLLLISFRRDSLQCRCAIEKIIIFQLCFENISRSFRKANEMLNYRSRKKGSAHIFRAS